MTHGIPSHDPWQENKALSMPRCKKPYQINYAVLFKIFFKSFHDKCHNFKLCKPPVHSHSPKDMNALKVISGMKKGTKVSCVE